MQDKRAPFRILVVEDEFLIRVSTAEMLLELGYLVTEAANAEQALSQSESAFFDILLTDMGLPGMSGAALAQSIRQRQPEIAVIFATGQGDVPKLQNGNPAILLEKPYDIDQLMDALLRARAEKKR